MRSLLITALPLVVSGGSHGDGGDQCIGGILRMTVPDGITPTQFQNTACKGIRKGLSSGEGVSENDIDVACEAQTAPDTPAENRVSGLCTARQDTEQAAVDAAASSPAGAPAGGDGAAPSPAPAPAGGDGSVPSPAPVPAGGDGTVPSPAPVPAGGDDSEEESTPSIGPSAGPSSGPSRRLQTSMELQYTVVASASVMASVETVVATQGEDGAVPAWLAQGLADAEAEDGISIGSDTVVFTPPTAASSYTITEPSSGGTSENSDSAACTISPLLGLTMAVVSNIV